MNEDSGRTSGFCIRNAAGGYKLKTRRFLPLTWENKMILPNVWTCRWGPLYSFGNPWERTHSIWDPSEAQTTNSTQSFWKCHLKESQKMRGWFGAFCMFWISLSFCFLWTLEGEMEVHPWLHAEIREIPCFPYTASNSAFSPTCSKPTLS